MEDLDNNFEDSFEALGDEGWSNNRTQLLIEKRLQKEKEFSCGRRSRSALWNIILKEIKSSDTTFPFTVVEIRAKFHNLMTSYKRAKSRNKLSGRGRTNWKFFEIFDETYGSKHSIEPPVENVIGSLFFDENSISKNINKSLDIQCSSNENEDEEPQIKKKKYNEEIIELLRSEKQEEKERHKEFLEIESRKCDIEERKVEAMNSLKNVMEEFLNKF